MHPIIKALVGVKENTSVVGLYVPSATFSASDKHKPHKLDINNNVGYDHIILSSQNKS
jgi:hypothetical protein